jgi:hypothetical protein
VTRFSFTHSYSYGIFLLLSPAGGKFDRSTVCPVSDLFPLPIPVMAGQPCFNDQRCRKHGGIQPRVLLLLIETGRADVPVGVASGVVQIQAPATIIGAVVAIAKTKGHRPECASMFPY